MFKLILLILLFFGGAIYGNPVSSCEAPSLGGISFQTGDSSLVIGFKDSALNKAAKKILGDFCEQCVRNDILLGFYSFEDLNENANLLDFLQEKTSKALRTPYRITGDDFALIKKNFSSSGFQEGEILYLPCNEALKYIRINTGENVSVAEEFIRNFWNSPIELSDFFIYKSQKKEVWKDLKTKLKDSRNRSTLSLVSPRAVFICDNLERFEKESAALQRLFDSERKQHL